MPTILRSDLTISGTYKLTDNLQLAQGSKITVLPGATLDLGGFKLLNFGTLSLEGSATAFAVMQNGTYSAENTTGALNSSFGNLKGLRIDSFRSENASLTLANSLVQDASMRALAANDISNSIFINSPMHLGQELATFKQVTFFDSPISVYAWSATPTARLKITDSNFVGASPVIELDSFFPGPMLIHSISISGSYVRIAPGSNFEGMVYDATDDLSVVKDLLAADFVTSPVTNSPSGFKVGTYTLSTNALLTGVVGNSTPVTGTEPHTLSVVVDKGVLGPDAVLLKDLAEKITLTDGVVTGRTVTYGATTFDYAQIDALIMTVTRDGNFTDEFRQEIADAAPTATALSYTDALALMGSANIDAVVLHVAGTDGQFVA
ncbi:hypothetical protein [Limnohabitans sp.]|uniref:hypothetical protein n=1 Tax=Limnohabitans sp. TaxID=1907725 RepID=UPI002AFFBB30|nr:hypothetical protein [Limnohabitans sp.]